MAKQPTPQDAETPERCPTCRCGAPIEAAPSGTYWTDVEGWDTCIGTEDSHEPADRPYIAKETL